MGVKVHDLHLVKLLRLELLEIGVDHLRGDIGVLVPEGQVDDLRQGEPAFRVTEDALTHVGDTLHDAVVRLARRGQTGAGIIGELHPALRSLLHLLAPVCHDDAVLV